MLFNSLPFLIYLPIVFALYWAVPHTCDNMRVNRASIWFQNLFVVIASYVFYGWWDWRFLLLISFTSIWSWISGLLVLRMKRPRMVVLVALIVNLGILGYFKYYNFFVENVVAAFGMLGWNVHPSSLQVILPVGISFYTFQALSYVIDVYRGSIKPTNDLVAFLAFVSFFPQLVAGPIERATNLLPQFLKPRRFDYALAVEGCRQMLWGFAKKVLVADSCASAANALLNNPVQSSLSIWIGVLCFTFQIYGDFSGYSDIAIGCSKLFGIRLMRNFSTPYFSRDIAEFWRRWHISLTTWFRDYLYIPMGGSRCGKLKKVRNTFVIFLVSGFWHGANWTYVAWGGFHAICFLPLFLLGNNRKYSADHVAQGRILPSGSEVVRVLATFFLVVLGWALFRAPDISTAFEWVCKMLTFSDLKMRQCGLSFVGVRQIVPVVTLLLIEWLNRGRDIPLLPRQRALRWMIYCVIIVTLEMAKNTPQSFIYFQF